MILLLHQRTNRDCVWILRIATIIILNSLHINAEYYKDSHSSNKIGVSENANKVVNTFDYDSYKNNYLIILLTDRNSSEFEQNYEIDKNVYKISRRNNIDKTPSTRAEIRRQKKQASIQSRAHESRMKEITDFMKDHQMTTKYFYRELLRIKRQKQVRDDVREMVRYLDNPLNHKVKADVLACYKKSREDRKKERPIRVFYQPNDNLMHIVKDPMNDGV